MQCVSRLLPKQCYQISRLTYRITPPNTSKLPKINLNQTQTKTKVTVAIVALVEFKIQFIRQTGHVSCAVYLNIKAEHQAKERYNLRKYQDGRHGC